MGKNSTYLEFLVKQWESELICVSCGSGGVDNFYFVRHVASGEVHECKYCKTENVFRDKPVID